MLDVEYISELTIALLNGFQNKKDKLEFYYQFYEEDFQDGEFVRETYDMVLGELLKIFPCISNTRWSKKTDFYSLFLVLANHRSCLPLSKDNRIKACNTLIEFGEAIKKKMTTTKEDDVEFSVNVENYAKGMRATTDLSSRRYRNIALEDELKDIWL